MPRRALVVGARRVRQGIGRFVARELGAAGVDLVAVVGSSASSAATAAAELERDFDLRTTAHADLAAAIEAEGEYLANVRQVTMGLPRAGEGYFSPDGKAIDLSDRQVVALIAYLQRLGTDLFAEPPAEGSGKSAHAPLEGHEPMEIR